MKICTPLFAGSFLAGIVLLLASCGHRHGASQDWGIYGGNKENNRCSPLLQINLDNIKDLQPAWIYNSADTASGEGSRHSQEHEIQCQPIVVDGVLYGTSPTLKLFALDAATGHQLWKFDPFLYGPRRFNQCRGLTFWANGDDKRIFYTAGTNLYSINARSGTLVPGDYTQAGRSWDSGDFVTARQDYVRAKEMDALRFRAPERLNEIIAGFGRKYDNVHLVDTRAAFEAASEHGIIGKSLLLEHVHPNLIGYALMSDVFYRALQQQNIIPVSGDRELTFSQLLAEMPLTRVDSLSGAYKIANLENNWPFNDTGRFKGPPSRDDLHLSTEEEDLAYAMAFEHLSWEDATEQLYDFYSKTEDWAKAATVMEALCLEHPSEVALYEKAGMLYGKLKENENAILYFGQAFRREPSFERAHYLFVLCLQEDRPADALPYLDYAIANNSGGMNLQPVRTGALEIMRLENQLGKNSAQNSAQNSVQNSAQADLFQNIARLYQQMGNQPAALKYIDLAARVQKNPHG